MAKKQTAKASKSKSSLFSKLVPRSSKAKLLTFLVVFSVIGGGVMAYRSFAASGFGIYTVNQLQGVNGAYIASAYTSDGGSKSGTKAYVVGPGQSVEISRYYQPVVWARKVRVCANIGTLVSSGGNIVEVGIVTTIGGVRKTAQKHTVKALSSSTFNFKKICAPYANHTDANSRIGGSVSTESNRYFHVTSMSIEYY